MFFIKNNNAQEEKKKIRILYYIIYNISVFSHKIELSI